MNNKITEIFKDYITYIYSRCLNLILFWNIVNKVENNDIETIRINVEGLNAKLEYNTNYIIDLHEKNNDELRAVLNTELYRLILHHVTTRKYDDVNAYIASGYVISDNIKDLDYVNEYVNSVEKKINKVSKEDKYLEAVIKLLNDEEEKKNDSGDGNGNNNKNHADRDQNNNGEDSNKTGMKGTIDAAKENLEKWGKNSIIDDTIKQKFKETVPTGWGNATSEFVDLLTKVNTIPKNNVLEVLRRFKNSVTDYQKSFSRMKLNRRYGIRLPGYKTKMKSKILVAIDDSGSMSRDNLSKAVGYLSNILKHADIDYCFWDCVCHEIRKLNKNIDKFNVYDGGTNPYCIGEKLETEKKHYDGVIMFTDFEFDWTENNLKMPLIMVDVTNNDQKHPFAVNCFNAKQLYV